MRHTVINYLLLTAALAVTTVPVCAQNRTTSAGSRPNTVINASKSATNASNAKRTVTEKGLSTPKTATVRDNNSSTPGAVARYNGGNGSSNRNNAGSSYSGKEPNRNPGNQNGYNRNEPTRNEPNRNGNNINDRNRGYNTGSVTRYNSNRNVSAGREPINYRGGRNPRPMVVDDHRDLRRVHPRDRGVVEIKIVNKFYKPSARHYFGYTVSVIPTGCEIRTYLGRDYYFYNDIWYRKGPSSWYVCRPPVGYSFTACLAKLAFNTCLFAYYCDVNRTYNTINENASIIMSQNETIARNNAIIAEQNEAIAMNQRRATNSYNLANSLGLVQRYASASEQYFYEDGVFYTKQSNGQYTVIVPPAGALVNALPDDYDTYTVGEIDYYRVDDTLYRMVVVDGSPYFEVLGQFTN